MTEWRSVAGYESYQVSSAGQVMRSGKLLHQSLDSYGYPIIALCKNGRQRTRTVHRIVAETFLAESYFVGSQVRHLDGCKTNNVVQNLKWGTGSENIRDAVRHRTHNNARKTHCARGHEFSEENTRTYIHKTRGWASRKCLKCMRENEKRRVRSRRKVEAAS